METFKLHLNRINYTILWGIYNFKWVVILFSNIEILVFGVGVGPMDGLHQNYRFRMSYHFETLVSNILNLIFFFHLLSFNSNKLCHHEKFISFVTYWQLFHSSINFKVLLNMNLKSLTTPCFGNVQTSNLVD